MCHLMYVLFDSECSWSSTVYSLVLARACVTPKIYFLFFSVSLDEGWVQLASVLFCYFL